MGRYVREVLAALAARPDVELAVVAPAAAGPTVHALTDPSPVRLLTPPRADQVSLALWDRFRAGPAFAHADSEVIIGCKHLVPRTLRPTLLVVHDVLTLTRARENALAKRVLLPAQYRRSLTDASALVAVSNATRDRLGAIDGSWAAKCTVIPNGMSERLIDAQPVSPPGIGDRRFALVVGDLTPRKNLALLTALWRADPPAGLTLVVVGPDSGTDAPVRAELLELERSGRAVWIRGAADDGLRWCYEHAGVVLFPTFEEGFGLPLLEAMTFHAPVVASDEAALLEVAAGAPAVAHVAPDDPGGWRVAIEHAVADGPRTTATPAIPAGAISWTDHTDRLVFRARALARGIPSPRTA
ncbi:MAG: glycosyltransferase [Acidimicrobiia bacterium]